MIKNYIKVAFRNLSRQKFYSGINIAGLMLGLATSLFIFLWIKDEKSKNNFHTNIDRIYYLFVNIYSESGTITWGTTPGPLAPLISAEVPEVEAVSRLTPRTTLFSIDDKNINANGAMADPAFFEIFSFPLLEGNAESPYPDINSMALSESMAKRFFPDGDAMGKVFRVARQYDMKVTAIYKDMPEASIYQYDFVLPFALKEKEDGANMNWSNYNFSTFYLLKENADPAAALEKTNQGLIKNVPEALDENGKPAGAFYAQPFGDYYLYNQFTNGVPDGGRIVYVQIFSVVALFILLLACINFMNLSTARAAMRAKEVGVRKSIGAGRGSLVLQFLGESFLLTLIATVMALGLVYLLLPQFNLMMEKSVSLPLNEPSFIMAIVAIVGITTVLAGSYPALVLSGFKPLQVLKGNFNNSLQGVGLRKFLVVFQFAMSCILLLGMGVIYKQLDFIQSKHLGYDKEQILNIRSSGNILKSFLAFKHDLEELNEVAYVSRANQNLMPIENSTNSFSWQGKAEDDRRYFRAMVVDYDFMEATGLKIASGRSFEKQFNDTSNFIITQATAKMMGMEDPIGQEVSLWGNSGKVVGVAEDFHSRSLQENIDPIVFMLKPYWAGEIYLRFTGSETSSMITALEAIYNKYEKEIPLEYSFMNQQFGQLYKSEATLGKLSLYFTAMAMFISCLGLFGLASFMAERKTREIGIRKVLGATRQSIVLLLCKDFVILVVVAFVLASPLAYYIADKFLAQYAYKTEISLWLFAGAGLLIVAIALITVSAQSLKAANSDPVKAIKSE